MTETIYEVELKHANVYGHSTALDGSHYVFFDSNEKRNDLKNISILKLNKNFERIWIRNLTNIPLLKFDFIRNTEKGDLIFVCGVIPSSSSIGRKPFIVYVNKYGHIKWAKSFYDYIDLYDVKNINGCLYYVGVVVVYSTDSHLLLIKTRIDGSVIWRKEFRKYCQPRGFILDGNQFKIAATVKDNNEVKQMISINMDGKIVSTKNILTNISADIVDFKFDTKRNLVFLCSGPGVYKLDSNLQKIFKLNIQNFDLFSPLNTLLHILPSNSLFIPGVEYRKDKKSQKSGLASKVIFISNNGKIIDSSKILNLNFLFDKELCSISTFRQSSIFLFKSLRKSSNTMYFYTTLF